MTSQRWPAMVPVRYVRTARPTGQLDEVVRWRRTIPTGPSTARSPSGTPDHWRVVLMPQPLA